MVPAARQVALGQQEWVSCNPARKGAIFPQRLISRSLRPRRMPFLSSPPLKLKRGFVIDKVQEEFTYVITGMAGKVCREGCLAS